MRDTKFTGWFSLRYAVIWQYVWDFFHVFFLVKKVLLQRPGSNWWVVWMVICKNTSLAHKYNFSGSSGSFKDRTIPMHKLKPKNIVQN